MKSRFSPEQMEMLRILSDPVLFAETFLKDPTKPDQPLLLRDFQKKMLRSKAQKRLSRIGRRSGKTVSLAVDAIYHAFTNSHFQILIACPFQSQVKLVFDTLNRLIKDSDFIDSSIRNNRTNPYEIVFHNGSAILGFTAGSSTGQKGGNIRGQNANYMILDEFDFLSEEAIEAIIAILATEKETKIWVSSTPSGKRETFFKWATDGVFGFKCFHYPSYVSPQYTAEADKLFRATLTEGGYEREILAEFGEETEGVYRHSDIEECIYVYDYGDPNPGNPKVLGIDWNSEVVGCELCSVEYLQNPEELEFFRGTTLHWNEQTKRREEITETTRALVSNKYKVFRMDTISKKNYTLTQAVETAIRLYRKYRYDCIYIDKGYGAMAEETLRERSRELGLDLHDRLQAIDFGSTIEKARDPITKKLVKKRAKYFMVENSVRVVEDHNLVMPVLEDDQNRLIGQMREYRVERRNESGVPVYSKGNDHKLDALNLAMLGFRLEMFTDTNMDFSATPVYNRQFIAPLLETVSDRGGAFESTSDPLAHIPKRGPRLDQIAAKHGLGYAYVQKKNDRSKEKHTGAGGAAVLPYSGGKSSARRRPGRRTLGGPGGRANI